MIKPVSGEEIQKPVLIKGIYCYPDEYIYDPNTMEYVSPFNKVSGLENYYYDYKLGNKHDKN